MVKSIIMLCLSFAILACDLISEKGGHDILLKLEKELMNYNTKIKQEQISLEKEKQIFVAGNPPNNSNSTRFVLSKESQLYLEQQISKSKELEERCNEIIQITSKTIKEMYEFYNQALQLEKKANEIKKISDKARENKDNLSWSIEKKIKVDNLSKQAQSNISPAKHWSQETKRIYQSLKDNVETVINNAIKHTYYLEEEIKMGKIPEIWINRISEYNQSANEIIKKCETIIEESAKQSAQTASKYVKELGEKVQESLNVINSTP